MSNYIEEKLKELENKYYGANDPKVKDILEDVRQALQEQEERIRGEMKEKLLQIVIEDVPHKYQERFLKELLLEFESNQLEGKGYDFYFAIRTKLDELLKD